MSASEEAVPAFREFHNRIESLEDTVQDLLKVIQVD